MPAAITHAVQNIQKTQNRITMGREIIRTGRTFVLTRSIDTRAETCARIARASLTAEHALSARLTDVVQSSVKRTGAASRW